MKQTPIKIIKYLTLFATSLIANPTEPWTTGSYYPLWRDVEPLNIIQFTYDQGKSDTENGSDLANTIATLQPGDRLEIGTGTYSVNRWWNVVLHGTEQAPIWVVAATGETPIITRPNSQQNVMNVAASDGDTTTFVCFRGLEFTGGSSMLRLYRCANVWVDSCTLHDGGNVGITANSANTDYLFITRNHIYNPGPSGSTSEGMYLGANNSVHVMRYSIVALNRVHDCGGTQGDGIEVKQGSYNNWIVENHVYNTNYPCIIAYGTDGNGINVIEKNIVHNSNDNTMQIQGEAIVRNNLIMNGGSAFASHDHQGETINLTVVYNTIINTGRCCNFSSWNDRQGMVFANNVVYSRDDNSLRFPNGSYGVMLAGNVVLGPVSGANGGYITGNGLQDFMDISWDASSIDARPSPGSPIIGAADINYMLNDDINGYMRDSSNVSGAFLPESLAEITSLRKSPLTFNHLNTLKLLTIQETPFKIPQNSGIINVLGQIVSKEQIIIIVPAFEKKFGKSIYLSLPIP